MPTGINDFATILSMVIAVLSIFFARSDKSNKDTGENSYKQGVLDEKLNNIFEKLDKIERKLDTYDNEIDNKIDKALNNHVKQYHKGVK